MSVLTKDEILDYLREIKPDFVKSAGIKKIGLFGSYAKGKQNEFSDIDLIFIGDKAELEKLGGFNMMNKISDLKDNVANHFKKNVDICSFFSEESIKKSKYIKGAIYV